MNAITLDERTPDLGEFTYSCSLAEHGVCVVWPAHRADGDLVQVHIPVEELSEASIAAGGKPFGVNSTLIHRALRDFKTRIQDQVSDSSPVSGLIVLGLGSLRASLDPSASLAPSTVEASLTSTSVATGTLTPGRESAHNAWISIQPGEPFAQLGPRPVPRVIEATIEERMVFPDTVSVERRLSERPQDIRQVARALSKAISDQIDELNASKPNDPDALTRQEAFIAFMQGTAAGVDELAASLEHVSTEASSPGLYSKSAQIALSLGKAVMRGIEENRATIMACSLRAPVVMAATVLLHLVGVSSDLAATISAGLIGIDVLRSGGKE